MATLHERRYINCPYQRARNYLEALLSDNARAAKPLTWQLSVALASGAMTLQKDVVVTVTDGLDPMHFEQPWNVAWHPLGGGPYPSFTGTISIVADEDYTTSGLELRGTYAPPFGLAGAAFDEVVGREIASATARSLLERIGSEIERTHQNEEAQKRAARETHHETAR